MTTTTAPATQTFSNVTIYLKSGFGSINRIDVREVTIEQGVKYAQYTDAIKLTYLEPRKRNLRGSYLTYKPFLIVVRREDAFDPQSALGEPELGSTPGISVRSSRYSSFDDRWVSDFRAELAAKNVTPLFERVGL